MDINVLPVWKKGFTGKGVVVSILDDGKSYTYHMLSFRIQFFEYLTCFIYMGISFVFCKKPKHRVYHFSLFLCFFGRCGSHPSRPSRKLCKLKC